ncbi:glutamate [NMDA] receptor subunit 1 isoform X2 [Zootermopsis nevadensis]|uniref:glutamate [NMDA] receptor subunit 1 isoform X2 n=1 Tax=Zootermopsis nevadensis TaxID=136037 RepID=UPI000B8EBF40|nr:glutamate [NMDA] receptor subunit 1 isoform X2 [Zootermopsis nevadensis]
MATSLHLLVLSILMQPLYLTADSRQHVTADVRIKNNPIYFNIGGVLSNMESQMFFKETISHLNFNSKYVPKGVTYDSTAILMDPNPIRTALNVCNYLINQSVYAVVVSHPLTGDLSPAAVSYTSGFYHIPVIGISSRDSAFSDKNIHVSFLRTVPPYSHQADVWVELLKHLGYRKVIFIHSSDTDGRALLGRFQSTSQSLEEDVEMKVQVESVIEFEPGLDNFIDQLLEVKNAQSRVYVMYAGETDSKVIFHDASLLNMTGKDYAWIVTEQALEASNVPIGILGLKLVNATSEENHIKDSIYVLASALRQMNQTEVITKAPKDCGNSGQIWETGKALFEFIRKQTLENGSTGNVAFDDNGDRINAEYDIINVQNQTQISVGQHHYSNEHKRMKLKLDKSAIIWPGNTKNQPPGFMIPTHLKVLTIEEKPFVYVRELQAEGDGCTPDEIPCPHFNNTNDGFKQYCCKGFCMDLLKELAKKINITYELLLSPDGQFGSYIIRNSTVPGKKEWTGLIGELVNQQAEMIVAPLTINPERAEFIEFSKPFKYQGITILEKKLRNTMENLTCATVKGSAVDMYFRRQVELSNMYRTMEANNYDTAEEAIQDVKQGKLMAFIWDSSRLEFEAAQDCELVTAGELFGRSGYGIGLQKGSPWADAVTLAILDFHESGIMESLDNRWILQGNFQQCEQFEKTPNTLGLKNMAGVFILVAAGIVGGIGLIIIEMAYKKHQIRKQKRMELARHAADKWRGAIEKRKTLRATMATQRRLKANGVNDPATVSLSVDALPRHCLETRSPARAWPGGCDIRQRIPHTDEIRVATTAQSNLAYGTGLPDMIV